MARGMARVLCLRACEGPASSFLRPLALRGQHILMIRCDESFIVDCSRRRFSMALARVLDTLQSRWAVRLVLLRLAFRRFPIRLPPRRVVQPGWVRQCLLGRPLDLLMGLVKLQLLLLSQGLMLLAVILLSSSVGQRVIIVLYPDDARCARLTKVFVTLRSACSIRIILLRQVVSVPVDGCWVVYKLDTVVDMTRNRRVVVRNDSWGQDSARQVRLRRRYLALRLHQVLLR